MGINGLRNKNCYCGSGKKFKKCHLFIDNPRNMEELNKKISEWMVGEALKKIQKEESQHNNTPSNTLGVAVSETITTAEKIS